MSDVLSPSWCEQVSERLAALPPGPGGSGVVALVVSGGEPDRLVVSWVLDGGRPTSVDVGVDVEPDVSAPLPRVHAEAILAGEIDPATAYMRGDLKPEGSSRAWFAFLSAWARDDVRRAIAG